MDKNYEQLSNRISMILTVIIAISIAFSIIIMHRNSSEFKTIKLDIVSLEYSFNFEEPSVATVKDLAEIKNEIVEKQNDIVEELNFPSDTSDSVTDVSDNILDLYGEKYANESQSNSPIEDLNEIENNASENLIDLDYESDTQEIFENGVGSKVIDISNDLTFMNIFMAKVKSSLYYPSNARKARITGIVMVRILFGSDSSILDVSIVDNDVPSVLKSAALNTIDKVRKQWTPSYYIGSEQAIVIPIHFELR